MEMNFASIAQLWKADKRPYVKKSTYAIYCHLTNKYLIPRFGAETALKGDEVQEWVSQKLADGLSIKTMKDIALILRMIQKFGAQMGAWPSGELRVRFPRQTPPEGRAPSIFTREDERLLLEQLRGRPTPRNIGLWLCLTTGLRIGEICALRWADVDLLAGTVRICHTLQRVFLSDGDVREDILLLGTPKSAASAREIPLGGDLLRVMRKAGRTARSDDYLLTGRPTPLEPRNYRAYYKRLLRRIGLPPYRFHALRHSFATRCIQSGCDCKTVSALLGHSSISTTLNLYVHPSLDDKRRCISLASKALARKNF